jgi:hypothetical protein
MSNLNKPSVTNLIKLLDKPALLNWANKIGLEGIKLSDYRSKVFKQGTNYHKEIEDYLKTSKQIEDPIFHNSIETFFKGIEVLDIEKEFEHDLFKGRLDIRYRKNNEIYISDFKSNQSGIYLENKLQLTAYRMALGCNKVSIISIPNMVNIDVEIEDFQVYEDMLFHLNKLYLLINK